MKNKTIIIAEAGVNHNGDIVLAKNLIDIAAIAGADYVKFQTFEANRLVTINAPKAKYQTQNSVEQESQFEMLRRLELSYDMHKELIEHCGKRNVKFLSTGFDVHSVNLLIDLGLDLLKIPSGEITNLPYLQHIGASGKKVILSTGMSTLVEVEAAVQALCKSGVDKNNLTILHCTSEYPTPFDEVNLLAINTLRNKFGVKVGYSDHTMGIEVAIAAVVLGATIIEKHFTLDRNLAGPDHKASLEPSELMDMVSAIRNVENALGDGIKQPTKNEIANRLVARKSIVASRNITAGELFTKENLTVKRPGTGVSPMFWDSVVGSIAKKNYAADEIIDL